MRTSSFVEPRCLQGKSDGGVVSILYMSKKRTIKVMPIRGKVLMQRNRLLQVDKADDEEKTNFVEGRLFEEKAKRVPQR